MEPTLEFFATPGPMTSLSAQASWLDSLPRDIPSLVKVVQGWMIHIFWTDHYGVHLAEARKDEVQLRPASRMLDRILELDLPLLVAPRQPEKRLVHNCRGFSVLTTALLRHHGVPARARCGFGRYFEPGRYVDHWVVEYWSAEQERWVLADAQLDELQCKALSINFDPLDVPRDQFIVGGKAWQLCRAGEADPDTFGIFDMKGLWFVRGDLVRDIAALNKIELLPWDSWGIIECRDEDLTAGDLALLDEVAALTCGDVPGFERVHQLYETDARLRVPGEIRSYTDTSVQVIDLALGS